MLNLQVIMMFDSLLSGKDFGVCYWRSHKGMIETPLHYAKEGKDIYEVKSEETVDFTFDLRNVDF